MKVLIIENQTILREALHLLLAPKFRIIAEFRNFQEAVKEARNGLIAQIAIVGAVEPATPPPDRAPIEAVKQLQSLATPLPAVLIACSEPDFYVAWAIQAKSRGIVTRDDSSDTLIAALHSVVGGTSYISPAAGELALQYLQNDSNPRPYMRPFRPRELDILRQLAQGATNKEIAQKLKLEDNTVRTYRKNMMRRLGVHNTVELLNATKLERAFLAPEQPGKT